VRRALAAWCACAALATIVAGAAPALAVDRSLGANVPKPAASGAPWTTDEVAALAASTDAALSGAQTLRGAHVGVYAIDARDGRVLYARNADDAFQPASTLKLVVGSAALDKLGPGFRFTTEAFAPGYAQIDRGELMGYLMLRGSGDVLLDDKALEELPAALRAAGIQAVHGVSFVDDRTLPPYLPGWSWDDLPWSYAAPVTPLGLNDNEVTLHVTPGGTRGARVRVTVTPWGTVCLPNAECAIDLGFAIDVRATTGEKGSPNTLDVRREPAIGWPERVTLFGSLAAGADAEDLAIAVAWPPRYAAWGAQRALRRSGFRVLPDLIASARGGAGSGADRVVWTHRSEPLTDMLADLWIPSDNILAEQLLRALGAPEGKLQGPSEAGIAFEKTWLQRLGVDPATLTLADGSGLSSYDRITPRALVAVLRHDWDGPYRDVVLDAMPIAGVRGTLASSYAGTAAAKRVFAKTGSMSHVSTLAGYVATATHGTVVFAFQVDDWIGDAAALRDLRGRVLAQIAGT
jgi:D-alanyl-D-alanine carboxypeptidase/D-alanyl-D-alanine-endopeptidase (penicillin-binding protein 4)